MAFFIFFIPSQNYFKDRHTYLLTQSFFSLRSLCSDSGCGLPARMERKNHNNQITKTMEEKKHQHEKKERPIAEKIHERKKSETLILNL